MKEAKPDLRQTAHDIRSPLSTLNVILGSLRGQIPESEHSLMCLAVQRINDIAGRLLKRESPDLRPSRSSVLPLVESIVREKKAQYRENTALEITADILCRQDLSCAMGDSELLRVISNLVDNSVEAIAAPPGRVVLSVRASVSTISIIIQDNGTGIPSHLVRHLGKRGVTFGKPGGSGLGLHHAIGAVRAAGGRLRIQSVLGRGTAVTIQLPVAGVDE